MKILYFFMLLTLLSGCTAAEFKAPDDEILETCLKPVNERLVFNTPMSCETLEGGGQRHKMIPVAPALASSMGATVSADAKYYRKISTPLTGLSTIGLPGLIVFIEAGTMEGNKELMSPPTPPILRGSTFGPLFNPANFPAQVRPNLRTLTSNLVFAFLNQTFAETSIQRYGHVYFVKGDAELKTVFLQTLKKATTAHPRVDLFIVGHGIPSILLTTKELKPFDPANLKADELYNFVNSNLRPTGLHLKVRSIFSTQSHGFGKLYPSMRSFHEAFTVAFPSARFYTSPSVNFYPLHRDFVMFEQWYETLDFDASRNAAIQAMRFFEAGSPRTHVVYPSMKGKACFYIFGYRRCAWLPQQWTTLAVNNNTFLLSSPIRGGPP